ncbi:MAG TPA: OsmC family protein [Gemmatimonadaceae bacterium]|nr:OsmC family protein [Gemmatimonadaceae bacterium]
MAPREHRYTTVVEWTGNTGTGTSAYRAYLRQHEISSPSNQKPLIPGSSDPGFRGDAARWNPEELLVASLSTCHQLWYLHLCADAGLVITSYVDRAEGVMVEEADGSGRFRQVTLRPVVTFAPGADLDRARALHHDAHRMCFIANSVNFPVEHEPELRSDRS